MSGSLHLLFSKRIKTLQTNAFIYENYTIDEHDNKKRKQDNEVANKVLARVC